MNTTVVPASAQADAESRAWRTLALLTLVMAVSYADRFVLSVLVGPIKAELGLSDTQIGVLTGLAFSLFYALCSLPIARVADRGSRRALLAVTLTAWSLATAATGLVRNFWQLLLARFAVGTGEAGAVPASYSMIGDLFAPSRRSTAISIFSAGGPIGMLLAMICGGWLGQAVGWRGAFVLVGVPGLVLALVFWLLVREPARDTPQTHGVAAATAVTELWRNRRFVHYIFAYSVSVLLLYSQLQWLPAFFQRSFGVTGAQLGFSIAATRGLGTIVGLIAGGLLADRLAKRDSRAPMRVVFWGSLVGLVPQAGVMLTGNLQMAYILSTLTGVVVSLAVGPLTAAIQAQATPRTRATAAAVMLVLSSVIGMGGGPLVVGMLSDALAARFGVESLRISLLVVTIAAGPWLLAHLWVATRQSRSQGSAD